VDEHPAREDDEPDPLDLSFLEDNLAVPVFLAVAQAEKTEEFIVAQAGEKIVVLLQLRGQGAEAYIFFLGSFGGVPFVIHRTKNPSAGQ
jgi:hypothetical protein